MALKHPISEQNTIRLYIMVIKDKMLKPIKVKILTTNNLDKTLASTTVDDEMLRLIGEISVTEIII